MFYQTRQHKVGGSGVRPVNTCQFSICLKPAADASAVGLQQLLVTQLSAAVVTVLFETFAGKAAALLALFHLPHHLLGLHLHHAQVSVTLKHFLATQALFRPAGVTSPGKASANWLTFSCLYR